MDMTSFWAELEKRITKYDLLTHSFYTAWSKGELTKNDLQMYATQYYQHVQAFPEYLDELPSACRRVVCAQQSKKTVRTN